MRNSKWTNDFSPLDENGYSFVDVQYSKAYLHHLFKAEEILALQIASVHNLSFYLWLMKEARKHISDGDFVSWKNNMTVELNKRV
jgi:queuine tRNA-ribosyltransferase